MPWRGDSQFVGQAYCVGGKSLFWGGWCPTLLDDDLNTWANFSPSVAQYLRTNYPTLQRQVGILDSQGKVATNYIEGPLFAALKAKVDAVVAAGTVPNLDTSENAPLAVQGEPPASGLFPFDKYSSIALLVEAVREAAGAADPARRLFVVPNAHVSRLQTTGGTVSGIQASFNGVPKFLAISPKTSVVLALGTIESTRMALASFPTSPDPTKELMGRNLMVHVRDNILVRIKRTALAAAGTLPAKLQAAAMLIRGSTPGEKFHLQVTASADIGFDPDRLLFSMIPDIDQIDALLAMETNDTISLWFRGVSESKGDTTTPVPAAGVSYINLSPFETDEFGVPLRVRSHRAVQGSGAGERDGRGRHEIGQHAGSQRPDHQFGPGRGGFHLPRGGHFLDGRRSQHLGHRRQRPVPQHSQRLLHRSIALPDRRVGQPDAHWADADPQGSGGAHRPPQVRPSGRATGERLFVA